MSQATKTTDEEDTMQYPFMLIGKFRGVTNFEVTFKTIEEASAEKIETENLGKDWSCEIIDLQ